MLGTNNRYWVALYGGVVEVWAAGAHIGNSKSLRAYTLDDKTKQTLPNDNNSNSNLYLYVGW